MSNSRTQNSGKSDLSSTIGFRFHANDEELEELQSEHEASDSKVGEINQELKAKPALLFSESLDISRSDESKSELIGDVVKEQWNILGRRSTSVDTNYESPFSNPIETWKKLNILKEKITKTVEEKISEMKMDRNVLSKSGKNKLMLSKENSSISDSEDTSESSKLSEQWKDAEDLNSPSNKVSNESPDIGSNNLESAEFETTNANENKKIENELRRRKFSVNSDLIKMSDIKIATAKSEPSESLLEDGLEDVENGVEAEEALVAVPSDSFEVEVESQRISGNSRRPPSGGSILHQLGFFIATMFSRTYTAVILIGLTLFCYVPMSDFMKGFLVCFILVVVWEGLKSFCQYDDLSQGGFSKTLIIPDYKSMPPLKVPVCRQVNGVWINEYLREHYDPDYYSVTQTVPAYLELEGSIIKISRPKGKIHKRATYDEPEYKLHFINQRKYNITGCNVFLMPEGLTRKRLFSKKYPIVIFLRPDSFICEKKLGKQGDEREAHYEEHEGLEWKNKSSLYLFARCDRQKEEWYRRLLTATRWTGDTGPRCRTDFQSPQTSEMAINADESPVKEPSTPFENLIFDEEINLLDEYLHYMVKFVEMELIHPEVSVKQQALKKHKSKKKENEEDKLLPQTSSKGHDSRKKPGLHAERNAEEEEIKEIKETCLQECDLQWFNAFVNRILFDVFRSPYWLTKIQEKIQRKLNSIRLPYYIEEIEVIELDLGKTGPIFHRVSQPYLDERGIWFDLDTTFDGFIRVTIQTHLNLVKLQQGFEENNEGSSTNEKPKKEKKKNREVDELPLIKEIPSASSKEKNRNEGEPSLANNSLIRNSQENPQVDSSHDYRKSQVTFNQDSDNDNLLSEVAQLAEMAVEESLKVLDEKEQKCEYLSDLEERSPIYDSEIEDSAESSEEEDEEEDETHPAPSQIATAAQEQEPVPLVRRYPKNRRSSKRLFRVFENVAQSRYFKSVAQTKYIQKAIAGVSAARLRLTLEIKSLTGTLTINIPPPPSDRFWYGFREMPELVFSANPKIGEKPLRFGHIKNYLQKKILHELKKVMVAPNMIDFVLPTSTQGRSSTSTQIDPDDSQDQEETPTE